MKTLINACGTKDSLNQDRANEIRGLIKFGGKPVVTHTLDKLVEIDNNQTIILTNPEHKSAYETTLENTQYSVEVCDYHGPSNPMLVYLEGLKRLEGDHVLLIADDNLFDFSLQGLIKKFYEVDDNTLVARNTSIVENNNTLNFGKCQIDSKGKITSASYSFAPSTFLEEGLTICDIYLVHEKRIQGFLDFSSLEDAEKEWFKDFYASETNNGFWADIGKESLRNQAEKYFNNP